MIGHVTLFSLFLFFPSSRHVLFIRVTLQISPLSSLSFNAENDQFLWLHIKLCFRFYANLFCPLVINPLQQNSDNIIHIMAESEADFYQPNLKINGELILFLTMKERQLIGNFVC